GFEPRSGTSVAKLAECSSRGPSARRPPLFTASGLIDPLRLFRDQKTPASLRRRSLGLGVTFIVALVRFITLL
uniref:Uncharacterized protein n=1 Tax=Gasterosteus aculeatus TaxID=69293 RepID=G3QC49_GASAC